VQAITNAVSKAMLPPLFCVFLAIMQGWSVKDHGFGHGLILCTAADCATAAVAASYRTAALVGSGDDHARLKRQGPFFQHGPILCAAADHA